MFDPQQIMLVSTSSATVVNKSADPENSSAFTCLLPMNDLAGKSFTNCSFSLSSNFKENGNNCFLNNPNRNMTDIC